VVVRLHDALVLQLCVLVGPDPDDLLDSFLREVAQRKVVPG
jgi:hypothetical protein